MLFREHWYSWNCHIPCNTLEGFLINCLYAIWYIVSLLPAGYIHCLFTHLFATIICTIIIVLLFVVIIVCAVVKPGKNNSNSNKKSPSEKAQEQKDKAHSYNK